MTLGTKKQNEGTARRSNISFF